MKIHGWQVAGKSWVGLIGSLLTFIIPWAVQVSTTLPPPWPALIAAVVALLTAFGVYQAPYAPAPSAQPRPTPWPT
jgi:hypothetical protein